ncbi:unnamed protein product, partial [Ectocarpus fasciculatus]
MLIVGGGPAGSAILTRAVRLGYFSELCGCRGNSAGVCVVEKGPASRFGGGKLLDYEINSNTWGDKFATNVTKDKPNAMPPESVTGTPLESLRQSEAGRMLVEAGNSCVPLSLVGQFLTEAGQILKSSVDAFSSSRVLCDTAVREVRRVQLGEVGTSPTAAAGSVPSPARQLWRVAIERKQPATDSPDALFAEVVVFANGGVQPITRALHPVHSKKALSSDFVCTKQGVAVLLDMLSKSKPPTGGSATNKDRKIVIIGGSHSAFSAAWICLNKLDPQKVLFSSGSICLVHRSPVLVFYGSKRDAEVDGYTDIKHINRNGQIHPFGGIRGDAKQLFRHVRNGKETRVRMLLLKGGSEAPAAAKLMDEAAVVIWSCGYQTNAIPVRDVDGEDIRLQYSFGQVEVDDNARVLQEPPPEPLAPLDIYLYATGLGYGLQATFDNGEPDGSSGRADGVAVYLKRSATLILSSVVGTKVYGDNATSWKERIEQ